MVRPDDTAEDCARILERAGVERAIVVDENEAVVGIVSQADLALKEPELGLEVVEHVSVPSRASSRVPERFEV